MAKVKVGYTSDWTGSAIIKVLIIAETIDERYVLQGMPIRSVGINGNLYWTMPGAFFLRPKQEVKDIFEEELEGY